MCALPSAVRPSAGGVPRRAAAAPSGAGERASSGKMPPRAATARDSSACLSKMTRNRNSVVTAGGGKSCQEPLQKRLASELDGNAPSLKRRKLSTPVEQQKFVEESKDDKVAEESKGDTDKIIGMSAQQPSEPTSATAESTAEAESESTAVLVYFKPNKPVFVRPVIDMAGLIYKAKLRKQQLEVERAALRDQSIHPLDLRHAAARARHA